MTEWLIIASPFIVASLLTIFHCMSGAKPIPCEDYNRMCPKCKRKFLEDTICPP